MSKLLNRLTYANVMATIALFVALGGSAYAASQITGKQIKDSSITTKDIKNRSLLALDFKAGQLPRGATGPQGPAGQNGAAGANGTNGTNGTNGVDGVNGHDGDRGPSDGYVSAPAGPNPTNGTVSVTVPAGDYVATASAEVFYYKNNNNFPASEGETHCSLISAGDPTHDVGTFATVPSHGYTSGGQKGGLANVSQNTAFHLTAGDTIDYTCQNASLGTQDVTATMDYENMRVTAVRVGTLH